VVKVKGKTLSTKWFGAGRREQRKAIEWEVQENKRIQEESKKPIPTESVTLFAWATNYLDDIQQRKSKLNYFVKRSVFRRLSSMVGDDCEISHLTPAIALKFLRQWFVSYSGYSANRDRQILGAAWEWGRRLVEGFPNLANPFLTVERFPEDPKPRYVPLLEDFDEILDTAEGQDLYKAGEPLAKIQKILRHQNATTTNRYLKSLGFEIEEIRSSVEVLARGAAKVIPLPQKSEAF
jgi:hypothetical protein